MIPWTHVLLHCSATKDGATVSWPAIRHYHKSYAYQGRIISPARAHQLIKAGMVGVKKPWRDIGYHYGIEQVYNKYETFVGRHLTQQGAHCPQGGMNRKAIGICLVGSFDFAPPPDGQWQAALTLVRSLMELFNIPAVNVLGHRDYVGHKTCPGKQFDLAAFRQALT